MIAYKKDKKFIYIDDNEGHHFTAIIHWDLYMKHRKDVPKIVKIFDTINDTYEGAMGEPAPHIYQLQDQKYEKEKVYFQPELSELFSGKNFNIR